MKKSRSLVILSVFLLVSLFKLAPAVSEPTGNLMYCRPGDSLKLYYMQTHSHHAVTIMYKKSFSDHLSDLKPGQCTWAERQLDYSEPLVARFGGEHSHGYATEYEVGVNKMKLNSSHRVSYKTRYLLDQVYKGRILRFCGYVKNGNFTINGFQYTRYIKITKAGREAKCN